MKSLAHSIFNLSLADFSDWLRSTNRVSNDPTGSIWSPPPVGEPKAKPGPQDVPGRSSVECLCRSIDRVMVIGSGYVALVTAASRARVGGRVYCNVDPPRDRVGTHRTVGRRRGLFRSSDDRHGSPEKPLGANHIGGMCLSGSSMLRHPGSMRWWKDQQVEGPACSSWDHHRQVWPRTQAAFADGRRSSR